MPDERQGARPTDGNFVDLQMLRLEGLDYRPGTAEALRDIRAAFLRARSNVEIREFVDDWLRRNREYPKPADVYAILYERRMSDGTTEKTLGDSKCADCGGTGFRVRTVAAWEGAEPCPCRKKGQPSSEKQGALAL